MKANYLAGGRKPVGQAMIIRALRVLNARQEPATAGAIRRQEPSLSRSTLMAGLASLVRTAGLIPMPLDGAPSINTYTLATYSHRAGVKLSDTDLRYYTRMENTALLMLSEHEKAKAVLTHGA
ncbi:hypothetical protein QCD83_26525 [Pseudomonas savastanoi pv. phaseolicola]|nr:hypothetical protein [Pseudomonas savastanoi]MDG6382355.1 hypothetical protein [Pseudomonas savastanoi pv. phaseolicola]